MPRLALYFLGAPRVEWNGTTVEFDTRKAVALLAYLAVTGEAHTRDAIATLLWPDFDQTHARAALRRTLSVMHKALGEESLEIGREQVRLAPGLDLWLDVAEFRRLLPECAKEGLQPQERACTPCIENLKRAVDLYRDDFLAGFTLRDSASFDDWQFFQSESLRASLAQALAALASCLAGLGDFEAAVLYARRWLALDNLNEEAHRQLMRLYAWAGRRNAALRQYRECARILEEQLGVEPLEETQDLYQAILEHRLKAPPSQPEPVQFIRPDGLPLTESQLPSRESAEALPLVGREAEWQALLKAYQNATDGYLAALEGEAGIGKSRLAEDLAVYAAGQGSRTALVRSYEGEAGLAYAPFMEALRLAYRYPGSTGRLRGLSPAWLGEASRLLPELASLLPEPPALAPIESPGEQARFFEAVRLVLTDLFAGELPGLLVLDDLHWADTASLDLLAYLLRRLRGSRLLILLTWRAEASPAQGRLQRMVSEAQRQGYAARMALHRLTPADFERLMQAIGQTGRELPESLGKRLYHEAEGLPLFVSEYLATLEESEPTSEAKWPIPSGVRGLLEIRLGAVDETGQQLLSTAAVIGRSFDFDILRLASGRSEAETVASLEALLGRGLIREEAHPEQEGNQSSGPAYDFSHEKLRDLVYEKISLARRRLLHRRVAEALAGQERSRPVPGAAGQIALHYHQAGESDLAAEYAHQAGDYARSLYAHPEALRYYRLALENGHPDRAGLQEAIGDLLTLLGEYNAAIESYRSALSQASQAAFARLEHKLGNVYHRRGEWESAESHFAAALQAVDGPEVAPPDPVEKANLLADWSRTAHHRDQPERALQLARQALSLAESSTDQYALALAHNVLGILARSQQDFQEASAHLERSLQLADQNAEPGARIAALNNLALVYGDCGQVDQAIDLAEVALKLCVQQGDRHREAALHNNLADLYHAAGQPEQAMSHLKQAVVIFAEIGEEAGSPQPEVWMLTEW